MGWLSASCPAMVAETLAALRERELVSSAYLEITAQLETPGGVVRALAYVVDPHHVQYCGGLDLEAQARSSLRPVAGAARTATISGRRPSILGRLAFPIPNLTGLRSEVRQIAVQVSPFDALSRKGAPPPRGARSPDVKDR